MKNEVRAAIEAIGWEARSQYRGPAIGSFVTVTVNLYWPTRANHDVDNIKGLLDALTGVLWTDDGKIVELYIRKWYDKENPRCEVEVNHL